MESEDPTRTRRKKDEFVGRFVKKEFEGYGVFLGKVVSFANGLYRVDYEDGDFEDLESHKVVELLVSLPHLDDEFKRKRQELDEWVVKKTKKLVENEEEDEVPLISLFKQTSPLELPPSSGNIGVPGESVLQLFSVYSFLRSFSVRLFLSPFKLDDFVGSLTCGSYSALMNAVHYSLLRALSRHLEMLSSESEDASICLRCLDWSLLDTLTWPIYLVEYLLVMGYSKGFCADDLGGEYYNISVTKKLMILQILCDNVMESAELRAEIDARECLEVGNGISATEIGEECRLCGMHGTLICCDGCPSEYHSRCIGLNQTLIPDGLWFCPECIAQEDEPALRISAGLKGAEIFGIDPYEHVYLAVHNHLLVLDLSSGQGSGHCSRYYVGNDIPEVLKVLCSSEKHKILYSGVCKNIMQYWGITDDTTAPKHYMGCLFKPQSYINQYFQGDNAASAATNYSVLASEAKGVTDKVVSADIALQLKAFSSASLHFIWPCSDEKAIEVPGERCGWCLACGDNTSSNKGCLLNLASSSATKGPTRNSVSICVFKNATAHVLGIATYISYMAERLQGLLTPPFLNHVRKWREEVDEAASLSSLKVSLLELEKHIRLVAFSADWVKVVDDWIVESSSLQNTTCSVKGLLKRQGGRRSKKPAATPEVAAETATDPGDRDSRKVNWWRGGKLLKLVFPKGILPRKIIRKAARQAGWRKISGVYYTEGSEIPKRRRRFAWRAAVEMSRTTPQLALQVRYLDLHLRWNDMVRPKTETPYRTAVICDKKMEEDKTRYGLLFHQKHLSPRVMKNCIDVEQSGEGKEILWFLETHVPLFLIKDFEQMEEKHSLSELQSIQTLPKEQTFENGRVNFVGTEIESQKYVVRNTSPLQVEREFSVKDVTDKLIDSGRIFDDGELETKTYSSFTENKTSTVCFPGTKPTVKESCKYCSVTELAPELHCKVCGCRVHIHCSPWIESGYVDSWKCGGCREWV